MFDVARRETRKQHQQQGGGADIGVVLQNMTESGNIFDKVLDRTVDMAMLTPVPKFIYGAAMGYKKHPNPERTVKIRRQSPLPEKLNADGIVLSPFDLWQCRYPLDMAWVYGPGESPSIETLVSGLTKLIERYPALGGCFRVEGENRNRVVCRFDKKGGREKGTPSFDLIVGREVEDDAENWRKGMFGPGLMASVPTGMPIREGTHLFEVRYTPVRGGRTVLSACMCHGIGDMQTFVQIAKDWSRLCHRCGDDDGGDVRPLVRQRNNLILSTEELIPPDRIDAEVLERMGWLVDGKFFPLLLNQGADVLIGKAVAREFTFTRNDVENLKDVVKAGRAWSKFVERGYRLSAHDVITALLWQSLAKVHPYHPDEDWPLIVVVNWRGISDRISNDYYGNATSQPHTSRSMGEVLTMDLSECALLVRELGMVCPEALENLNSYFNHVQYSGGAGAVAFEKKKKKAGGLDGFINIEAPNIENGCGFRISNFSKFDVYSADFGTGRPEIARFAQAPLPGYGFAYNDPDPESKDVTVVVSMAQLDSNRLEGFDFASGEAIVVSAPPFLDVPHSSSVGVKKMASRMKTIQVHGQVARGLEQDPNKKLTGEGLLNGFKAVIFGDK